MRGRRLFEVTTHVGNCPDPVTVCYCNATSRWQVLEALVNRFGQEEADSYEIREMRFYVSERKYLCVQDGCFMEDDPE